MSVVKFLLKKNVDLKPKFGADLDLTPILAAAMHSHDSICRVLLTAYVLTGVVPYEINELRTVENFTRVHVSIKPPVWSPASSPSFSESRLARLAAVSSYATAQPSTIRASW